MRDETWAAMVERLERWRAALALPGLAFGLVTRDGEMRIHAAGHRDLATGAPFGADTLFPIGSLAKGFTAVLAALLARDGLLALDDPLTRHLPELRLGGAPPARPLTLRDLLGHRSGLGHLDLLYSGNRLSAAEQIAHLASVEAGEPGQAFLYSNINYVLAGEALARAAGRSWRELLRERLLAPLGMAATIADSARFLATADRAVGYQGDPSGSGWRRSPFLPFDAGAAAGGIQAPLADLTRWLRFLLREAAGDLAVLWAPPAGAGPGVGYGLGFKAGAWRGLSMISHEGNLPGFSASLGFLPEAGSALVLLVNTAETPLQQRIYREAWDRLVLEAAAPPEGRATFPGPALERDLGQTPLHFRNGDGSFTASLYRRGDRLALDVPGQRPVHLEGPNAAGVYLSEGDLSLGPVLLRQPGEEEPHGLVLLHFQELEGWRIGAGERAAGPADAATVTAVDRLAGRYRLAAGEQEAEIRHHGGRLEVEIPHDGVYALDGSGGDGRWRLEEAPLQSLEFHGGAAGPARALTWRVTRPVELARFGQGPPPISREGLLALRRRARSEGGEGTAFELRGQVSYPHQAVSGEARWWIAPPDRYRYEEDLGRFGSVFDLRLGERLWAADLAHDQPLRELAGSERESSLAALRFDAAFAGGEEAADALLELAVLGVEECAGQPCYRVWLLPRAGDPVTRWVCRESGRVLCETRGIATTRFADFRTVAGVSIPFLRTTEMAPPASGRRVVEIRSATVLEALPPGLFAVPGGGADERGRSAIV